MKSSIQSEAVSEGPSVLLVVAHPDDEYYCAAAIYRLTHELGGTVDELIITNGEGGYRYAALAERVYGCALAHEEAGRQQLPDIRKGEVISAGHILGIRTHYFLDQPDRPFPSALRTSMEDVWDRPLVEQELDRVLAEGDYDFVFTVLPTEETHMHHQAATLLALERVAAMPESARPIVLGCAYRSVLDRAGRSFSMLPDHPISRVRYGVPMFSFDRRHRFGFKATQTYAIIVHWMMAEHKSQGFFQTTYGQHEMEDFWYFASNGNSNLERARALFNTLQPRSPITNPEVPSRRSRRSLKHGFASGRLIMNYAARMAARLG